MKIRCGYEIIYDCPKPTPMMLMLSTLPELTPELLSPDRVVFDPPIPATSYLDLFGNTVTRIVAPQGRLTITNDFLVHDDGMLDERASDAELIRVEDLPDDTLVYLLGSRYCETDLMSDIAWSLFGHIRGGWARVQAICDFTNDRITFGYEFARPTKTAFDAYSERQGVCRDFAHLAVTLCRCMNVPARYCTGYLGDIGVPVSATPMDFSGWFEAFLGGRWYTFDARHAFPRTGRILMGRGRDATDVAITTTFGSCTLAGFTVVADEVPE